MRFETIKISEEITKTKGIEEINMQRLSNVVALVGKNGSGKSRILDLIEENVFNNINFQMIFNNSVTNLPKNLERLKNKIFPFKDTLIYQEKIKEIEEKLKINPDNEFLKKEKNDLNNYWFHLQINPMNQTQVENTIRQISHDVSMLKKLYFRRIRNKEIQQLQQAIGNEKDNQLTFETLIENVTVETNYDELQSIHKSALRFLSKLPHQLAYDQYDCIANNKVFKDRISYKRFLSLKKFIKDFLNKDLTWEQKTSKGNLTETGNNVTFTGEWKIEGRPFNYSEFSDGEKTLFAYALLFFLLDQNPNLNIKESMILIDEPELHLHPDSEIDLIEGIKNAIGDKGQLIIATHSINILSMLNYEEIFMVKDGIITSPSQYTPGKSLSELMGIEDRVNKLSDFLSSISTWTFVNFIVQCFTNPDVIEFAHENDPQVTSLKELIALNSENKKNLLLDFGAGKGRLYEQAIQDEEFKSLVEYYALEPDNKFHHFLTSKGIKQIFSNYTELEEESFDFIVLCNVLHEIKLEEWLLTLNKIINALKASGSLIIIEAKYLTKGEQIGTIGYLLLDEFEIQTLFNLKHFPFILKHKESCNNITSVLIPKTELSELNTNNILETMKALEINTFKKIQELRFKKDEISLSTKIGREYAFLSQLHINSKLAQNFLNEQINKTKKKKPIKRTFSSSIKSKTDKPT